MTLLPIPPTEDSYGAQSLVVLTTKPASLAAPTVAEMTAGINISMHVVGSWYPTADTDRASTERKMGATNTVEKIGSSTHKLPTLTYTHIEQAVDTAPGNEARKALPEGAIVYLALRNGVPGNTAIATGNRGRFYPAKLGPQIPSQTKDDAAGDDAITQELGFAPGYTAPVPFVVA